MNDHDEPQAETPTSVAGRVLAAFVEAVADDPELGDVAERLRATVLTSNNLTEAGLRQALFGDSGL